ncbi:MAG: hypothetical protein KatS3mg121_0103 [Gammaproteobacteria bacterium]|nr:MAG: hypothetical protein KatS3mg121_0103 [Gammaproteobacteria bacterium]
MRAALCWIAAAAAGAMLLAAAAVACLSGSEAGSRWLVSRLLAAGEHLRVARIDGRLRDRLVLTDLVWDDGITRIELDRLSLRWRPAGLLYGRVDFGPVDAGRLRVVRLGGGDEDDTTAPPPVPALPLTLAVDDLNVAHVELDGAPPLEAVQAATLRWRGRLLVRGLALNLPAQDVHVQGALAWPTGPDGALHGELNWQRGRAAGRLSLSGRLQRPELAHRLEHPYRVESRGRVVWRRRGAPLLWLDTRLPRQAVSLGAGRLELEAALFVHGPLDALRGSWTAAGELAALGPLALHGRAHWAEGTLRGQLALRVLGGRIEGPWRVTPDSRRLEAALTVDALEPSRRLAHAPQRLDGHITLRAGLDVGPFLALDAALGGRWNDQAFRLDGPLHIDPARLSSDGLRIRLADNRLWLAGLWPRETPRLGRLQLRLEAPRLDALPGDFGLAGALHGGGRIEITQAAPRAELHFEARGLEVRGWRAETGELALSANGGRQRLELIAAGLGRSGEPATGTLRATWRRAQHRGRLTVALDHPALELHARLEDVADFDHGRQWRARLDALDIDAPYSGPWQLERAAPLSWEAGDWRVDATCLSQAPARLCLAAHGRGGDWRAEGRLEALPLAVLPARLGLPSTAAGVLDGRVLLRAAEPWPAVELQLESGPGRLQHDALALAWTRLALWAQGDGERLTLHLEGDPGGGRVEGTATLTPDRRLAGEIELAFEELTPFGALLPAVEDLHGRLTGRLTLAGFWDTPELGGRLNLREAGFDLPEWGLRLRGLSADLERRGAELVVAAAAQAGDGRLRLEGRWQRPPGAPPTGRWRLTGERAELLDTAQLGAVVDPDLVLTQDGDHWRLEGRLHLPRARIHVADDDTDRVDPSPDETRVGAPAEALRERPRLETRLTITLGEAVRFTGRGLDAGLRGHLEWISRNEDPAGALYGSVETVDGRYEIYRQVLHIERGRLVFQGPYDDPGLDIVAVRAIRDGRVGLRIVGTLKHPRSQVFSDPPLPESDAMALLITGRPLSAADRADANLLINAVARLGVERGQALIDPLVRRFGLDDVRIEVGSGLEATTVHLGKRLSERLRLEYVVDLFERSGRVLLEYRLGERLRLEARSGESRSIDLFYRLER